MPRPVATWVCRSPTCSGLPRHRQLALRRPRRDRWLPFQTCHRPGLPRRHDGPDLPGHRHVSPDPEATARGDDLDGDGSAKVGVTHEGFNFAAVRKAPVIYILQNNQVALGTRLDQHHLAANFDDWPQAYGVSGGSFDGNNVLDAYAATRVAVNLCLAGEGPVILIAETFRMEDTRPMTSARREPSRPSSSPTGEDGSVGCTRSISRKKARRRRCWAGIEAEVEAEVEAAALEALADKSKVPAPESALERVYAS